MNRSLGIDPCNQEKAPVPMDRGFFFGQSALQRGEKMLGYAKSEDFVGWLIDL
ncbi:hypothetical protein [Delftia acidovorans]|uniref:hypothetical protein n=1 Tax=Delftia acidovorans TaxID=80866 RepID=UPI00286F4FC0|nr:hypothetical protein [Delftia acidovorans]